jgi:predicted N-acetyltransferase YhbS
MSQSGLSLSVLVTPEQGADAVAVERLSERAFGPGRFARTAYRLRERTAPNPNLCFVARISTLLVGSNQMTPIRCGQVPALLLGPLTVDPAFRSRGIGAALVNRSLDAAVAAEHRLVILIGDEPYYGRFGFARVPAGQLSMPGPVDPARLLYRELAPGAFAEAKGAITPARAPGR